MTNHKMYLKSLLTLVLISIIIVNSVAQPANFVRVRNGKDATKSISAKERFQFGQFQNGKLVYTNGKVAQGRLNYCYIMGEVMYIDFKGDTLLIADNNAVDHAEIGKVFYHADSENGYQEIIDTIGTIILAKRIQYKIGGTEKKGAYNSQNDQGSISNAGNYSDPNTGQNVILPTRNNTVLMRPITFYFLVDGNKRTYKANSGNFLKIYAKNKGAVEKFLTEENINFNSEQDLKKAIEFCNNLGSLKS